MQVKNIYLESPMTIGSSHWAPVTITDSSSESVWKAVKRNKKLTTQQIEYQTFEKRSKLLTRPNKMKTCANLLNSRTEEQYTRINATGSEKSVTSEK